MIWRCLDSLAVLAALAAVYLVPPMLVLRRLYPASERSLRLVAAAGLGISTQALIGFFFNHFAPRSPLIEACTYYLLWLTLSLILPCLKRSCSPLNPEPSLPPPAPSPSLLDTEHLPLNTENSPSPLPLLSLILLAAFLLRSFDALDHASLGQSDAYTHLQFLRDVIAHGQIRNIVYPPGYSWVLALPAMTFNLDAYMVARYAGPFFGTLMVATLYLLGSLHKRTTGLIAAFLAAVCPLFYPLIKTGMGTFANQMGLFLLPLLILLYVSGTARPAHWVLFTVLLLGLAASVPMFVFSLALIVFLAQAHRLLVDADLRSASDPLGASQAPTVLEEPGRPSRPRLTQWIKETAVVLLPFLLAFALAAYHFLSPGERHVTTTATLVTGIQTPAGKAPDATAPKTGGLMSLTRHPAGKLLVDLITPKRAGLGSPLLNAVLLTLACLFGIILILGRRSVILSVTGLWGLLTTLQVGTGLLEFSLYQRSGWLLLQAIALVAGIVMAFMILDDRTKKIMRPLVGIGLLASLLMAFWMPPQHRTITSGAENELATVLRELSVARIDALQSRSPLSFDHPQPSPLILRAAKAPKLTVITRRYTLFNADQGNMAAGIPDPAALLRHIPVETGTRIRPRTDHILCLIDRYAGLPDMGLLDRISPALTQSLASYQPLLYEPNQVILAFLASLPKESWRLTREERGKNLTLYLAERTP